MTVPLQMDTFWVPAGLYGSRDASKKYWRSIVQKIAAGAPASEEISQLEQRLLVADQDPILIGKFRPTPDMAAPCWRLHWITNSDLWPENSFRIQEDFFAECLTNIQLPWILLAWLPRDLPRIGTVGSPIWRKVLDNLVHWLPEIEFLSDRFANECAAPQHCREMFPDFWKYAIVALLYLNEIISEPLSVHSSRIGDEKSVSQWLERMNVIEPADGRFVLK